MNIRPLGRTSLNVSDLCLGSMQFGWTADEAASCAVLDAFVAAGGNFIDTADIYSRWAPGNAGGVSEEIIGRWMKERGNRDAIVIATKVRGPMWEGADGEGLSRAHIARAVEDSLRRLQVETIDLYQCHWADEGTPIEETLAIFGDLVRSGKIRYIGASNYNALQLQAALDATATGGFPRFDTLQPHYNLVKRPEFEAELRALCEREGIAAIPYSPLAAGFLTGKYRNGQAIPASERAGRAREYMNDAGFAVLDALDAIAKDRGTKPAAVALSWQIAQPVIAAPIIGANTPEQLADLLPASSLALTAAEIAALNAASAPA